MTQPPSSSTHRNLSYLHVLVVVVVFCLFGFWMEAMAMEAVETEGEWKWAWAICARIPGLTELQRNMCRSAPDTMVAAGQGSRLALGECQRLFRHRRWNCSLDTDLLAHSSALRLGSREAAFATGIESAGMAYAITQACARGNLPKCRCDTTRLHYHHRDPRSRRHPIPAAWVWGGCSPDLSYGLGFSRRFLDQREWESDPRALMNLHNSKAGRKALKQSLQRECKCHGVSGSCTMKTCWKTLPPFAQIGEELMRKYMKARAVIPMRIQEERESEGRTKQRLRRRTAHEYELTLRSSPSPSRRIKHRPRGSDLVYLHKSPNYCEWDPENGSYGTHGRTCNRTSSGTDGCDLMCCGRGYNTHQLTESVQCRCKFTWCCHVECHTCNKTLEIYTCK